MLAAQLADAGRKVDAVIVDAPYSAKVHAGHDLQTASVNHDYGSERRALDYAAWAPDDVDAFVDAWEPLVSGWAVSLTDDGLFGAWRSAFDRAGRQTFQDIPCVIRGMSVRLVGDGPSSWAIHAAVARPRNKAMASWGTLDGAYIGPSERQPVVGGKPLWLMRALVHDYTRPGDLVCDPCAGGFTTALACVLEGRRFIGSEPMQSHFDIGVARISEMPLDNAKTGQLALMGRT